MGVLWTTVTPLNIVYFPQYHMQLMPISQYAMVISAYVVTNAQLYKHTEKVITFVFKFQI